MADYSTEIAHLEKVINAAMRRVSTDGLSTDFDLEAARKRLAALRKLDDAQRAAGLVRPTVTRIRLDSAW